MFQPQLSGHFSHLCCAVVNFWLQRRRQRLPAATRPSQPPGIQKQLAIDISHGKVTASEMFRYRASESKMYDQWWQRVPPSDWRNSREVWSSSWSWGMKSSTLQEPFTDHPTCFQRGDIETLMRSALPRIHFSLPDSLFYLTSHLEKSPHSKKKDRQQMSNQDKKDHERSISINIIHLLSSPIFSPT